MLDELLEYYQYTEDPKELQLDCLKYAFLKSALPDKKKGGKGSLPGGISRAMSVIARYFLSEKFSDLSPDEQYEKTKAVLRQWCGISKPEERIDCAASIESWFKSYIEEYMVPDYKAEGKSDEAKRLKRILEIFQDKCISVGGLEGDEFYSDDSGRNTENRTTYGSLIHEAGRLGRLRCYYLTGSKPLLPDELRKRGKTTVQGRPVENDWDLLMKALAAYLLEAEYPQRFIHYGTKMRFSEVNKPDVCNWSKVSKKEWPKELEDILWKGPNGERQVFERLEPEKKKSFMKLRFNYEFYEAYHWKLVSLDELEEFLEEHPGYAVYADQGSCKPLEEFQAGRDSFETITARHRKIEALLSKREG